MLGFGGIPNTNLFSFLTEKFSGLWRASYVSSVTSAYTPTSESTALCWFEADSGVTTVSGAVSQWNDQVGLNSNFNLSQATSTLRPTFNATDADFNNKPSIHPNGTSHVLDGTLLGTVYSQPITWYACLKWGTFNSAFLFDQIPTGTVTSRQCFIDNGTVAGTGYGRAWMDAGNSTIEAAGILPPSATFILCIVYNGSSTAVYVNDMEVADYSGGNPGTNGFDSLRLFASYANTEYWSGKIAAIGAFSDSHDTNVRHRIASYLKNKYISGATSLWASQASGGTDTSANLYNSYYAPTVSATTINSYSAAQFTNPKIDPSTLTLSGLWAGNQFTPGGGTISGTWAGTSSAGTSGSHNLTDTTMACTSGTGSNGYASVDFNGTSAYLTGGLISTYISNRGQWGAQIIFKARTAAADPGEGVRYSGPCLFTCASYWFNLSYSSVGVALELFDFTGTNYTSIVCSAPVGQWNLVQIYYDSTTYRMRVNTEEWKTATFGNLGSDTLTMYFGADNTLTKFFDGEILDLQFLDYLPTNADFDGLAVQAQTKYKIDCNYGQLLFGRRASNYLGASSPPSWSFYALVNPFKLSPATTFNYEPALLTDEGSNWAISISDSGVRASQYDIDAGAVATTNYVPIGKNIYSLIAVRFNINKLQIKVNDGDWTNVTATSFWSAVLSNRIYVGVNGTITELFDGSILELGIAPYAISDVDFKSIKSQLMSKYGFPTLPSPFGWWDSVSNVNGTVGGSLDGLGDKSGNARYGDLTMNGYYPNRPVLTGNVFANGALPGIDTESGTTATPVYLSTLDALSNQVVLICDKGYSAWAVFRTTFSSATASQPNINPPMTIIGNTTGSSWNNFGLNGGNVSYTYYSPTVYGGWHEYTSTGLTLTDGNVHTIAVTHSAIDGTMRLYADGKQVYQEVIPVADYQAAYTGMDAIGVGYSAVDPYFGKVAEAMAFNDCLLPSNILELHRRAMKKWSP